MFTPFRRIDQSGHWLTARAVVMLIVASCIACAARAEGDKDGRIAELKAARKRLRPLHEKLGKPQRGDWLAAHSEQGQTFEQYLASSPVTPTGKRSIIYLQPLGDFDQNQERLLKLTENYLSLCYHRPAKRLVTVPLSDIPPRARRRHPVVDNPQVLSTYVLDELLPPRLPDDGAALIALTTSDLWPGEGWNFVFGQANLRARVGVWSTARNGNSGGTEEEFRLALRRTLKIASHELGHMFSIQHCTAYKCCMNGSNNLAESDRQPLHFCPECIAKICWATESKPAEHYRELAKFFESTGLKDEAAFCKLSGEVLVTRK